MSGLASTIGRKVQERLHRHAARKILNTPPITARDDGVVIFSMIGTRVLTAYLVAVKSLHAALGRGRIAILDDGTLTDADRQILRHHLDDPQIVPAAVDTRGCPTYSSWRRLFTLLELARGDYVIQLDSDTVTLGAVDLLVELVDARRDFILRGEPESAFMTLPETSAQARRNPAFAQRPLHVQLAMEAALENVRIPGLASPRYARGCAGFAGFAPDPAGTELAERFSAEASRLIGFDHWSQWGSEQVTSNFLIAQRPQAVLLPYDRYCNFWNEPLADTMAFAHFIGSYRYHGGVYSAVTRQAIARLSV